MEGLIVPQTARERLTLRFGPAAHEWCDALPGLVTSLAARWRLRACGEQLGGGTSRVIPCVRADGVRAFLKLTPDPAVAAQEAEALRLWEGSGRTARLLAADTEHGALLLEQVAGADGAPAPALRGRDVRWEQVAALLGALRGVRPGDRPGVRPGVRPVSVLPALAERVDFVFGLTRRRVERAAGSGVVTPELMERGHAAARALARNGRAELVHGDLHPGNVLDAGPAAGLVAIDPRPAVGDPDFDAVDWALLGTTTYEEVERRARRLAAQVDRLDADRLLRWCHASAVIIAAARAARGAADPHNRLLLALARASG